MGGVLTRGQLYDVYYCGDKSFRLLDLFSSLGIKANEVRGKEFDYILKLVKQRFRKLSPKYHPDKRDDKVTANKEFQKFAADKEKLEKYLNALQGKKYSPSSSTEESTTYSYFDPSTGEEKEFDDLSTLFKECGGKISKTDKILSRKLYLSLAVPMVFLGLVYLIQPSKVEFCLLQLAANGSMQNIAYQFYTFNIGAWPWLLTVSFVFLCVVVCVIAYKKVKEENSLKEASDKWGRVENVLITTGNCIVCIVCIASTFAVVCSLVTEVAQNGWPVQYGTVLVTSLALELLLIVLLGTFIKASGLYSEYCIQRLYKEDIEFSYEGELEWYDPRKIFMPIILPIVKMLYGDFIQEKPQQHADEPEVIPIRTVGLRTAEQKI